MVGSAWQDDCTWPSVGQGYFTAGACVLREQGKMCVQPAAELEGVIPAWGFLCRLAPWHATPAPAVPGVLREDYIVIILLLSLSSQSLYQGTCCVKELLSPHCPFLSGSLGFMSVGHLGLLWHESYAGELVDCSACEPAPPRLGFLTRPLL